MRRSVFRLLLSILSVAALPLAALDTHLFHDNQERQMQCDDHNGSREHFRFCEVREQTITSTGSLRIDAGNNGGVSVKGWNRPDVLVRSRVEASADSMDEAKSLAASVATQAAPGDVRASGPETHDHRGWSVSYEVFVPHLTGVTARAHNGGIHATDIGGVLDIQTVNGGLHLTRVTGDVKGETVNGGVHVDLMGDHWDGRGLELSSTNGGVHINVPANYSARLESSTVNGGMRSDFPELITAHRHGQNQSLNATLGGGGATVRVTTVNGGVSIGRSDK